MDNCERESLLELIVFPDEDIQVEMEAFLSGHPITQKDETEILTLLIKKDIRAMIIPPDSPEKIFVRMDDQNISLFLARLNLSKTLDKQLATAIETCVKKKYQLPVRVKFRNAGFLFSQERIDFLCEFFSFFNPEHPLYVTYLDFIIDFLHAHDGNQDIYTALNAKKRSCYRYLQSALKFQEQLAKYNIETLMMKGIKNQSINIEEMEETIHLIHNITMTIFGRSEEVF